MTRYITTEALAFVSFSTKELPLPLAKEAEKNISSCP